MVHVLCSEMFLLSAVPCGFNPAWCPYGSIFVPRMLSPADSCLGGDRAILNQLFAALYGEARCVGADGCGICC
jgi:hypothetical protein